jgi:hypothetical protein
MMIILFPQIRKLNRMFQNILKDFQKFKNKNWMFLTLKYKVKNYVLMDGNKWNLQKLGHTMIKKN